MAATLSIAFTATPVPALTNYVIEASQQVSAGRNFMPRAGYKFIAKVAAAGASPANILAAYNVLFGALVLGSKIFIRAYAVSTVTGERSGYTYTTVIVT